MMMSEVSVVMCTYNGVEFLKEQLDSILNQTAPIAEVIIQDDCSTDGTWSLIEQYAALNPCIRAEQNATNLGFNENFRRAMLKAKSTFVAVADQDDIWYPQKIERQLAMIGACDICFSAYHRDAVFTDSCSMVVRPQYNPERLMFVNCIPGHSMLVRREFLHNKAHWNPHICYDWWFLIHAVFENGIAYVDEPLNWHRPHAKSAIAMLHKRYARKGVHRNHPAMPFIYGWRDLRHLRNKEAWQVFYHLVHQRSGEALLSAPDDKTLKLLFELSDCLLNRKTARLCALCFRYRKRIYPDSNIKGLKGCIRGFFYPLIYAYNNTNFEM